MSVRSLVSTMPGLPWRLRHGFERWLEGPCRSLWPGVYRWMHFGRAADRLEPVSRGPKHHFFGYYEKCPWNASQHLMLAHEADFNDRPPADGDRVRIGIVHLDDGRRFETLADSQAWNWQQGAMLQWHPADPERRFLYNDRRGQRFVAVDRTTGGEDLRVYDRPISAVAADGRQAFSLNFARLQTHRPGYGYAGLPDPWAADRAPDADGIHALDLATGRSTLIVSVGALARLAPTPAMALGWHYFNHVQVSPNARRIAFFHIWTQGASGWEVRLYTADLDGQNLRCVLDTGRISHYDWLDDRRILVWARHPGGHDRFLLCDAEDGRVDVFGAGALNEDGHCSFSPDRQWVLNDTYPDGYDMRTLMLVRFADQRRFDVARLYSPKKKWWGEVRCDLHPRWSRDGHSICVDSVHDGTRQMYVMNVEQWLR